MVPISRAAKYPGWDSPGFSDGFLGSLPTSLKGSKLGELWKYRVGDYRIIADIEDGVMRVLVLKVGNRREVYRS